MRARAVQCAIPRVAVRHSFSCWMNGTTNLVRVQAILIEEDLLLHRTIFETADNRVCRLMFSIVHELLHNLMEITSRMVDLDHTVTLHRRIDHAIRKCDASDARANDRASDGRPRPPAQLSPATETIANRRAIFEVKARRDASRCEHALNSRLCAPGNWSYH